MTNQTKPWLKSNPFCCPVTKEWNPECHRVHCWKNHVPYEVKEIWSSLTDDERLIISWMAEQSANAEEWD